MNKVLYRGGTCYSGMTLTVVCQNGDMNKVLYRGGTCYSGMTLTVVLPACCMCTDTHCVCNAKNCNDPENAICVAAQVTVIPGFVYP